MTNFFIGLPKIHLEPGEHRDFLPDFVARLHRLGAEIILEHGYGSGMGYSDRDYREAAEQVQFGNREEVYQQDYVLILRYPGDDNVRKMRPGACLISMLHYPTRPQRVAYLCELNLEAISLDSIVNDAGQRMVENFRAVAWNGMQVAFETLKQSYPSPGLESPKRSPVHVTLLGVGAVGGYVIQAAIRYGNDHLRERLASAGIPGVQVTVVDYDLTNQPKLMHKIFSKTDILVDATRRPEPSKPVIPNSWLAWLPAHTIITDLAVDPYSMEEIPPVVRGIEGIPQGNLDKYVFEADDPDWDMIIPASIPSLHRRTVVSCYSWPGIYPQDCMRHYGQQLEPFMQQLIKKGYQQLSPKGEYFERALHRATLKAWLRSEDFRTQG
jgi:alanine dehydrogenase